jgi:hypothetical protein
VLISDINKYISSSEESQMPEVTIPQSTVLESQFFNHTPEETALVAQIKSEGYGLFKLKQLKTGAFVEGTKVTGVAEEVYTSLPDRVIVDADPDFIYMYVDFVPIAVPTPPEVPA